MTDDVRKLVAHIKANLANLGPARAEDGYPYAAVPLCIIDAIFSLGVRYELTWRTVCSWSDRYNWEMCRWLSPEERTVSDFINILEPYSSCFAEMATQVFCNSHRTFPVSGILKAEAVYRFSLVLQNFGIQTLADAAHCKIHSELRIEIERIPGQGSGLSYNYFLMLAGHDDVVKADRMVRRFVGDALCVRDVGPRRAEELVQKASATLQHDFPCLTPSLLDSEIWKYQRNLAGNPSAGRHRVTPWVAAARECARLKPQGLSKFER